MKKRLLLFIMLLLPMMSVNTFAEKITIGKLRYIFSEEEAEVVGYVNTEIGSLRIPSSVSYEGKEYTVTSIGISALESCSSLTSVTIPNSVTSIGNYAFRNCNALKSIVFSNSVTSIGNLAFSGCTSLKSVTIPNSVNSIGYAAFTYCSVLTSIIVEEGNTTYDSRDNCNAIIETLSNTLITGCKNTIIPYGVRSLGRFAFAGTNLTSITTPNSLTRIGYNAFSDCRNLTSIVIGNSVMILEDFSFNECYGLVDVYCYAETAPQAEYYALYFTPIRQCTLHVPSGSISDYAAKEPWNHFDDIVALKDSDPKPTGIMNIRFQDLTAGNKYDIKGCRLSALQKGLNIIKTNDGKTKKVIIQ